MKDKQIKLSVVIPCFNKPNYLIEMIKCIMAQTFQNWELILVDDGSDEVNYIKIKEFVLTDNRIHFFKRNRKPKNGDTCRNIGMDLSRGEYTMILDADDLLSETCFEKRVAFMDKNPKCDYASFPSGSFYDGNSRISKREFNYKTVDILGQILEANYPFTVWANIYRTSSIKNIRWDEKVYVYQDFDFMVQCELAGLNHLWCDLDYPDYYYRLFKNGNSVCSKVISKQKVESTLYLFDKIAMQISNHKESKILIEKFLGFVVLHYERLLLDGNKEYINSYLFFIKKYYNIYFSKFNKIANNTYKQPYSHFELFKLYSSLYFAFKYKLHRSYMIHELVKIILFMK